jgi:hypothetical protein
MRNPIFFEDIFFQKKDHYKIFQEEIFEKDKNENPLIQNEQNHFDFYFHSLIKF